MPEIDRRQALGGAGKLGAAALNAPGPAPVGAAEATTEPRCGFALVREGPDEYDCGTPSGAYAGDFPVRTGQDASVHLVHLAAGDRAALDHLIPGRARWTVLGTRPDGQHHDAECEVRRGDRVRAAGFLPLLRAPRRSSTAGRAGRVKHRQRGTR